MPTLEPEVAIARFNAGEQMICPIEQLARAFKMHPDDFKPYLASGELTAHVIERSPDGKRVRIGLDLQEIKGWMGRHNIAPHGKPLYSPSTVRVVSEARWKAIYRGDDIEIPADFVRSLTTEDWETIRQSSYFDRGQCARLWKATGRKGRVPKRLPVYANMDDVERLVEREQRKRARAKR